MNRCQARWRTAVVMTGLLACPLLTLPAQRLPAALGGDCNRGVLSTAAARIRPATCVQAVVFGPLNLPAKNRGRAVAKGAMIGAVAGTAAGVLTAYIYTHRSFVTDHSEDGLVYAVFIPTGLLLGALVGVIVGASSAS